MNHRVKSKKTCIMIEKKHKKQLYDHRSTKSDEIYKSKRNRGT